MKEGAGEEEEEQEEEALSVRRGGEEEPVGVGPRGWSCSAARRGSEGSA